MPIEGTPEPGGLWAGIGAAVVGLGWAAYRAMRTVKTDSRQDDAVAAADQRLRATVADLEARLKEERARADLFAKERMEFSAQLGRLSGLFEALEDKVKALEDDKRRLEAELQKLEEDFECIKALNHHLVEESAQFRTLMVVEGLEEAYTRIAKIIHNNAEKCAPASFSGNAAPLKSRG